MPYEIDNLIFCLGAQIIFTCNERTEEARDGLKVLKRNLTKFNFYCNKKYQLIEFFNTKLPILDHFKSFFPHSSNSVPLSAHDINDGKIISGEEFNYHFLLHENRNNQTKMKLWRNFCLLSISSAFVKIQPFYDGQWFIIRFKMCLLPFCFVKSEHTKGISISPISNHPVYCTFDDKKDFISFLFFALYTQTYHLCSDS